MNDIHTGCDECNPEREHLERELARYYPNAKVTVTYDIDAEQIYATFDYGDDASVTYIMQIGSDDDCYDFVSPRGSHITVPFHPDILRKETD